MRLHILRRKYISYVALHHSTPRTRGGVARGRSANTNNTNNINPFSSLPFSTVGRGQNFIYRRIHAQSAVTPCQYCTSCSVAEYYEVPERNSRDVLYIQLCDVADWRRILPAMVLYHRQSFRFRLFLSWGLPFGAAPLLLDGRVVSSSPTMK